MKKRTKLFLSGCSLVVALALMVFGVYSAVSPQVSISGYVTFRPGTSQISIKGTIIDGYDTDGNAIEFVAGESYHYYDYTDSQKNTLADWVINNGQPLNFFENALGVKDIKLRFEFVNNSPFYTIAKFEGIGTAGDNVTITSGGDAIMDTVGNADATKTVDITYSVIDDSKTASASINFNITFERYLATQEDYQSFVSNASQRTPLDADQIVAQQAAFDAQRTQRQNITQGKSVQINNTQERQELSSDTNNNLNSKTNIATNERLDNPKTLELTDKDYEEILSRDNQNIYYGQNDMSKPLPPKSYTANDKVNSLSSEYNERNDKTKHIPQEHYGPNDRVKPLLPEYNEQNIITPLSSESYESNDTSRPLITEPRNQNVAPKPLPPEEFGPNEKPEHFLSEIDNQTDITKAQKPDTAKPQKTEYEEPTAIRPNLW